MWVYEMKFLNRRSKNPFDNFLYAALIHASVMAIAGFAIYYSLYSHTLLPLLIGAGVVSAIEAMWLYYRFRR